MSLFYTAGTENSLGLGMQYFVEKDSVVRLIWGKADTVLFIFAGAAAEFALNKAVDWLYFTGRLPADPVARLFSTVSYARKIVFAEAGAANKAIDQITAIHAGVEKSRGAAIPAWAYRDVLFMLIYYSIASFEVLERKLTLAEKEEVFDVFYRVGKRMGLQDLPHTYATWLIARQQHLEENLQFTPYTKHLTQQYRKHLGWGRYLVLLQVQSMLVPPLVKRLLQLPNPLPGKILFAAYKGSRAIGADKFIKSILYIPRFRAQLNDLEVPVIA